MSLNAVGFVGIGFALCGVLILAQNKPVGSTSTARVIGLLLVTFGIFMLGIVLVILISFSRPVGSWYL